MLLTHGYDRETGKYTKLKEFWAGFRDDRQWYATVPLLVIASEHGHAHIVKELLRQGADINAAVPQSRMYDRFERFQSVLPTSNGMPRRTCRGRQPLDP